MFVVSVGYIAIKNKMAQTVISANYPPHIDPTRTPLAYGDRALPRLVRFSTKSPYMMIEETREAT